MASEEEESSSTRPNDLLPPFKIIASLRSEETTRKQEETGRGVQTEDVTIFRCSGAELASESGDYIYQALCGPIISVLHDTPTIF